MKKESAIISIVFTIMLGILSIVVIPEINNLKVDLQNTNHKVNTLVEKYAELERKIEQNQDYIMQTNINDARLKGWAIYYEEMFYQVPLEPQKAYSQKVRNDVEGDDSLILNLYSSIKNYYKFTNSPHEFVTRVAYQQHWFNRNLISISKEMSLTAHEVQGVLYQLVLLHEMTDTKKDMKYRDIYLWQKIVN